MGTDGIERRRLLGGALALMSLPPLLAACGSAGPQPAPPGGQAVPGELSALVADVERTVEPVAAAPGVAEVTAGMRDLAIGLHEVGASVEENWTVSPVSIALAFGMLRAGARGATADQLDELFGYPAGSDPAGDGHRALGAISADLVTDAAGDTDTDTDTGATPSARSETPPPPVVAVANGLFVDRAFAPEVARAFLDLLAQRYGARATAVTFDEPSAAATINAWVAEQTRGRITTLFDKLPADTELVLANAVYLKASWAEPFDEQSTIDGPFSTASGGSVEAPLMSRLLGHAAYDEGPGWQRVLLPYAGGELSMRVVVPSDRVGLPGLHALLATALAPGGPTDVAGVQLTLPRWDTKTTIDLAKTLRALGVTAAFDPERADFSGIRGGLYVSQAVHKANVTVDETGTEAAAVTGIGMALSSAPMAQVQVRADRPFVWAVVHEPTGTPVFVGHVVDPTR